MAEREWREASDMRSPVIGLALVVLTAGILRFWALGAGIPYAVGVDEPDIMTRVVAMLKTGDFNPHFFDYPGFYFYAQLVVACGRFLQGALAGAWRSLDQVGPADFYLWARGLTALLGTLTVLVVHRIGLRWGTRHALLAAGLMAVMPMHVRESHYVLTDVPMTFFVTLAFLLSLGAHEKATMSAFAWAGAAAGLAAATKYNGALAIALPLVAASMTLAAPSRLLCALAASGGALGAYLVAAPYSLLDLPAFLNAFARLASAYRPRGPAPEPGWLVYLKHLRLGLGWPALLLACGGLGLGLVRAARGPGHVRWTLLVAFPIVWFYVLATKSLIFGRYLLPMLPFVCILAAIAVISGVSLLRRFAIPRVARTALIVALTGAAVLPPAVTSIRFDRTIGRQPTQALAYGWIARHVPSGSRIVIEKFDIRLPEERYRTEHVRQLIERRHEEYVAAGADYLIASSQVYGPALEAPHREPERYAAYRRLFEESHEVARFSPDEDHPGPELRIFKVRR